MMYCKDNFDAKSSLLSNKGSRQGAGIGGEMYAVDGAGTGTNSYKQNAEINLQKINNIYTSPFFLINAQCRERTDTKESIQKIWDDFDYLEGTLMNQHINNSNMSDQMRYHTYHGGFDSQSHQDCFLRPNLMIQSVGGGTSGQVAHHN